jgi:hypothetical protein
MVFRVFLNAGTVIDEGERGIEEALASAFWLSAPLPARQDAELLQVIECSLKPGS